MFRSKRGRKPPPPFEEIVKMYSERVFKLIYSKVNNYDDAMDLAQDVFYNAFRSYKKFRGESEIFTWLYRIAVNRTNRYLKMNKIIYMEELPEIISYEDPEEYVINEERKKRLKDAIDKLEPYQREIIFLRYYDELDYEKISEILGIPVGTVKSRLARAKEEILQLLRDNYER